MTLEKSPGPTSSLTELEAQIQQLLRARDALQAQRLRAHEEELKILADAFARKLQAAGFSISQGIAALRPYARTRLGEAPAASPLRAAPARHREGQVQPHAHAQQADPVHELRSHAARVLGDEGARWLGRPHPLLGGQSPMQTASTPQGTDRVHALLAAYARGA